MRPSAVSRDTAYSRMSVSLPPLPPTNTQSGAGSASSASGASPDTTTTLSGPNCSTFKRSISRHSASRSTAYTIPSDAMSAASSPTEPLPAPTSHTMLLRRSPSLYRLTARTSALVISPRCGRFCANASSGKPSGRSTLLALTETEALVIGSHRFHKRYWRCRGGRLAQHATLEVKANRVHNQVAGPVA